MGINTADITVKRQSEGIGRCFGDCKTDTQDRVGTQAGFILRAIQFDEHGIDGFLFVGFPAQQVFSNFSIYILDCFQHSLTVVAIFIAISHFKSFMYAGRCTGGDSSSPIRTILQDVSYFNGGVATRIENFQPFY